MHIAYSSNSSIAHSYNGAFTWKRVRCAENEAEWHMLLIQNATNDWTKSWLILPALYRKSAKLFVLENCQTRYWKTMSETSAIITSLCCMKHAHYSKRMLRKQDCIKFCGRIAWQSVSENNFADFSDVVRVKKIKISSSCWWRLTVSK